MSRVGVQNLHYYKMLTDTTSGATYDAGVVVPGLVHIDVEPATANATLYADDGPYEAATSLGQITVTVELADLPKSVQADLLGHSIDASTDELVSKSTDVAPYVGIAFESEKANGQMRYVKLAKGKFAPPADNYQTKGESVEFQTATITGIFVVRQFDKVWKQSIDSDDTGSNVSATIAAWYDGMMPPSTPAVAGKNTYEVTTNFVSTDTVTFNGVTVTAGTDFNVGASVADSAGNLATAMTGKSGISGTYNVTSSGAVITVTEKVAGGGNTPGDMTVTGTGVITAGTATPSTPAS